MKRTNHFDKGRFVSVPEGTGAIFVSSEADATLAAPRDIFIPYGGAPDRREAGGVHPERDALARFRGRLRDAGAGDLPRRGRERAGCRPARRDAVGGGRARL